MLPIQFIKLEQQVQPNQSWLKLVVSLNERNEELISGGSSTALPSFLNQANRARQTSKDIILGDITPIEEIGVVSHYYG
ncbi:hypothetical protein ACN4EK_00465 [Pantanalinema rosaneae CENA516]|uniref:hypothetical protein n=1 Tax=Pantanalinema rosaneae TaxID=1620701 RepID=UPI003D6DA937